MWWVLAVPFAAAEEPLRLAAVEVGTAAGNLSDRDGVQARAEWSTGRSLHVGAQGSWNGGPPKESGIVDVDEDPTADSTTSRSDDVRLLATLGFHLDDRRVQVGIGLAAGPWIWIAEDAPVFETSKQEVGTFSGTTVSLAAFWTTSIRVRVSHGVGVYLATTGDLTSARADGSFGIGWTR